jgi:hypothetical protein
MKLQAEWQNSSGTAQQADSRFLSACGGSE